MADEATTAANMRYLALMHRRSAPPRCHPVTILVMVMSSGLLFIGLTMTIIANWPGSTTIGENPLKIAGPILLALGGLGFIIGIILVSVLNKKEKKKFEKSINNLAASRVAMNQSQTSLAGSSKQPQLQGYPSGSGPPASRSAGYNQAEINNGAGGNDEMAKLTALNNSYQDYQGKGGGAKLSNVDEGDSIPQPIRLKKPKKQVLTSSSENMTSEEGQELLDRSRQSNDQVRGSQSSSSMDVKKRQQATSNQYVDEEELLEAKDKRARNKPATAAKPSGGKPTNATTGSGQPPPSPGEAQRLRVHVKTAPGATVRIHQGPASSLQPQAAYAELHNKSASSQETDF